MSAKIIHLENAQRILGCDENIVAEVVLITPAQASDWLRCNQSNRPARRHHVNFLAGEIKAGNWQLNGQAIVIAEDEQVLDGQHRLMAIIEAGIPVRSLVVYGITPEAFKTMDTGITRTGADALFLTLNDINQNVVKAVATAVQWCSKLERQTLASLNRVSNTGVISYLNAHPSLIQCADTLAGYPKEARPLSLGCGTAMYEMFARKKQDLADKFMRDLYTGENLVRTDVEYVLRQALLKDATRNAKLPSAARMRMVIKGWNWRRRGMMQASHQTIALQSNDEQRVTIL